MPEDEFDQVFDLPVTSRFTRVGYVAQPMTAMDRIQEEATHTDGPVLWDGLSGRTVSLRVENLSSQMVELLFGLCSDCWVHLPVCDCHERGRE